MTDSETKPEGPTPVETQEYSEAPQMDIQELQNIEPASRDAVSIPVSELPNADTKSEEIKTDSKSSEKLLTKPHAVEKEGTQDNKDVEEQVKVTVEEYEEEIINEDGTKTVVKKVREIKEPSSKSLRAETVSSFIEKEEEYEEEEIDESGQKQIVKKKRMIQVPREKRTEILSRELSYTEIEEEYEEEDVDESGQSITIKKKRIVKVSKKRDSLMAKGSEQLKIDQKDEISEKDEKVEEEKEKESVIGDVEEVGEEEDEFEDVEEEEEEDVEELEDVEDTEGAQEIGEEQKKKVIKKKKKETDEEKPISEEGAVVEKVKKRRRRKRKEKSLKQKPSKSEISKEDEKEEEAEEVKSKEDEIDMISVLSKGSEELRHEEERAAIGAQFEILTKLRNDYISLRRKLFFLNNKLIMYIKKQKMEHLFTEIKDDPDAELKYANKLSEFYEISQLHMEERLKINTEWEAQRSLNEELAEKAKQDMDELMAQKKEIASKLLDGRTGRTISHDKTIEDLLIRLEHLLKQISECRLIQIKLRRRIEGKKEERKMDHMGADFNLMDYEKLSSLKEYYMDKITERDIEIGEVSQKLNNTEDKLKNVKEKLREKQDEMNSQQQRLQRISSELNKKRASLNHVKATRHKMEKNTSKMKQQSGLLSYPNLLKDYDEKNEQVIELTNQIETYKQTFRYYTQRIRQLQEMSKKKSLAKFSTISPQSFLKN